MKPLAPIHWPYLGDGILAMAGLLPPSAVEPQVRLAPDGLPSLSQEKRCPTGKACAERDWSACDERCQCAVIDEWIDSL